VSFIGRDKRVEHGEVVPPASLAVDAFARWRGPGWLLAVASRSGSLAGQLG
jgi:uncharacterized protein YhdP